MDDDGLLVDGAVVRVVLEVEADGQLEVELDGGALEVAPERVHDGDVDFRAVKGAVPRIQLPRMAKFLLDK